LPDHQFRGKGSGKRPRRKISQRGNLVLEGNPHYHVNPHTREWVDSPTGSRTRQGLGRVRDTLDNGNRKEGVSRKKKREQIPPTK